MPQRAFKTILITVLFCASSYSDEVGHDKLITQLKKVVPNSNTIQFYSVGPIVYIDGESNSQEEMARIHEVIGNLEEKGISVRSLVRLSKEAKLAMVDRINRMINDPEVSAYMVNNAIVLEGTADNDFQADRTVELTRALMQFPGYDSKITKPIVRDVADRKSTYLSPAGYPDAGLVDLMRIRPKNPPPPKKK